MQQISRFMHIVRDDLGFEHLWVVYPGSRRIALTRDITVLPLVELPAPTLSDKA